MDENPLSPKKNENTTKLHHHQYWQGNGTEGAIVPRVLLRNGAITDDIGISDPLTQGVGTGKYSSEKSDPINFSTLLLTIHAIILSFLRVARASEVSVLWHQSRHIQFGPHPAGIVVLL